MNMKSTHLTMWPTKKTWKTTMRCLHLPFDKVSSSCQDTAMLHIASAQYPSFGHRFWMGFAMMVLLATKTPFNDGFLIHICEPKYGWSCDHLLYFWEREKKRKTSQASTSRDLKLCLIAAGSPLLEWVKKDGVSTNLILFSETLEN